VDDLASACLFLMERYDEDQFVNVGSGTDIAIKKLAEIIAEVVGFKGEILWDTSKPDGTPKKLMDVSKMEKLGWKASISLQEGIESVYQIFKKEHSPE
jgi:GDP-L-fucose synthase